MVALRSMTDKSQPGGMCAWVFRQARPSRTLLGTASWERGRPARILISGGFVPVRAGRPRSQDAVPAQVALWGEIRRNAPRTGPKP